MGELSNTLRGKLPTIVAGATAAVTIAVLSHWLDTAGTLIGAAATSAVSGTVSTMYEHALKKSAERARQLRAARHDEWSRAYGPRRKQRRDIPWKRLSIASGLMIVLCLGSATAVEALSRKPLAVTGGSVGAVTHQPAPTPTYTYTPPVVRTSNPTVTPTPTPTSTPTQTPTVSPSPTPSLTPSPTVTPTLVTPTP